MEPVSRLTPSNLLKLQQADRRLLFPSSYESMRQLFEMNPDEEGERFRDVLGFIAQVSPPRR